MPSRISRRAALAAGLSAPLAGRAAAAPVPKDAAKSWVGQTVLPRRTGLTGVRPAAEPDAPEQRWGLNAASWQVKAEKGDRVELVEDGIACWVEKAELIPLADAVAHFTKVIAADATDAYAYNFRGWAAHLLGKSADAVKDFDKFLEIIPADANNHRVVGLSNRGLVLAELGKFDAALKDLDEAVKFGHGPAKLNRGWMLELKGDYKAAAADFEAILADRPADALALNNLAWLRATCPVADLRDAAAAVRLAKRVCDASGNREGMFLDTLAAAHAEAGDFAAAVKAQELALQDAGYVRKEGTAAQERLQLYKDKKPYRTAPPSKK